MEDKGKDNKKWGEDVWINDDGIICFGTVPTSTEEEIDKMIDKAIEFLRKAKGEGKILVRTSPYIRAFSGSEARKRFASKVQKVVKETKFKKAAIFGGDVVARMITLFVITASGIKDIKVFDSEESAINWLKES